MEHFVGWEDEEGYTLPKSVLKSEKQDPYWSGMFNCGTSSFVKRTWQRTWPFQSSKMYLQTMDFPASFVNLPQGTDSWELSEVQSTVPFIEENLWQQNQKSIKIDPFWQRQDSFFWTKKTSAASCFSKSSRFSVVISFWLLHQEMFDRAGIDSLEEWGRKVFIQEMRH